MNDELERRNAELKPEQRSTAPPKAATSKGSRGRKIGRGLVVASAAAVVAVYAAGYAATQSAASQVAAAAQATPPVAYVQTVPTATSAPSVTATSVASAAAATATSVPAATAAVAAYKDGTYTGVGVSRHGSIQATVVIQNGKIVSARITNATTRYPTSRIASLPGEVVSQQSANVNYVSGATDSSVAYLDAVASALAQAA